jgi:phage-related protein
MINGIVNWFKKLPGRVLSVLSSLVSSAISKFNSLKSRAISSISGFISSAISKISSFVSNFISKIAGLPGKAASKFNSLKSTASNILGGIAKNAYSWGKNLISSFISGITSKLGALKSTLSNTAGKVKNFLGFHSPTKEGPGKDSNTWMPNLMKMLSESMLSKRSLLQDSVKKIAGDISFDKVSADIGINTKTGNSGALTGTTRHVNININNPQIFDRRGVSIVAEQIKTELQAYMNFKKG